MPATTQPIALITASTRALKERVEEVNRLNVFPVPDGDTGTNMALTMDAVLSALAEVSDPQDIEAICRAITHGSLMGARGNSGVTLSQILRGLCDVIGAAERIDAPLVAAALNRSVEVAFQAVRKPVEGTMLTVLKDAAHAASDATSADMPLDSLLDSVIAEAFASVRRTPELLPVLKQNNVVDAGGFGLAILAEGLLAAYHGQEVAVPDVEMTGVPTFSVVPENDWDDDEYLYCTEFLLFGADVDSTAVADYVGASGGSELVVGADGEYKVHVHTDDPGAVLAYMTSIGEVAEVHVNNMRRQTAERSAALAAQSAAGPRKPLGIVTVATGTGINAILESLGADVIVSGGQTMNPSTAELLEAAISINADSILILPNNKNIIMAAQQAAAHAEIPIAVIPTTTVPEAFSALLAMDPDASLVENTAAMTEAIGHVRTGEVTTAIKDSKAATGKIKTGDVIGITDGEIEFIGTDVVEVAERLIEFMLDNSDTVTLLAGLEFTDEQMKQLADKVSSAHPEIEVETHRGEQPLYPLIVAVE
ncbi:MAG: DAK2 domain-containing protein [Coriobacteriia bacterium]|nr:DAK2 domain-containing protein [Coriobacteriia bacterium]